MKSENMKKGFLLGLVSGTVLLASLTVAHATYIQGAVGVTDLDPTGDQGALWDIGNIIDQSGLDNGYSNGDNFESFTSLNSHTWEPDDNEWWGPWYSTTASVLFDLGDVFNVGKVAFWNEDWSGITEVAISVSDASGAVVSGLGVFSPTDQTYENNYFADIFTFSSVETQYLRFDLVAAAIDPPDPTYGAVNTITVGEVAFSVTDPVPEPATVLLFGVGITALLGYKRRKR